MIILMGIALTILCICSVMELALLLFLLMKSSAKQILLKNIAKNDSNLSSEPASVDADESMKLARKRYEEELVAFQDLLNYNADVAYGVESLKSEE